MLSFKRQHMDKFIKVTNEVSTKLCQAIRHEKQQNLDYRFCYLCVRYSQ